jgi:RNA polymerase sigma factor (sigma-70 family)
MNYHKEELITINFLIEQILCSHFSSWVKPQDRDEVRQELMYKILQKKLKHSDLKGNIGQWLYRLIQNHLTDTFRKNRRSIIHPLDDLSYLSIPEDEEDLMKEELHTDRWNQYTKLLSRENSIDQQLVRLKHEKGLKYDDISRKLHIPIKRLAMRYKRIKVRLNREFRPNRLLE